MKKPVAWQKDHAGGLHLNNKEYNKLSIIFFK